MFLTFELDADATSRQVEFVLSEKAARQLGQALTSGSIGLVQQFNLSVEGGE